MRVPGLQAAMAVLPMVLLVACSKVGGEPEDPAVSANQLACDALARPGGGDRSALLGFAGVAADGLESTTGGAGGSVYEVRNYHELAVLLADGNNDEPRIIQIADAVTGPEMLDVGSNTTLIGAGENAAIQGFGLRINGASNIIIADLEFNGGPGNALRITGGAHHVWLHHNAFSGYDDDAIEIREGASYVTVAWNRFRRQNKVLLAGHSDENAGQDVGRLKVTYHHNWFDGSAQRHPLVRFGEAHVFNNFYDDVVLYGAGSAAEAEVLVQANYFDGVRLPTSRGSVVTGTLDEGDLVECGNAYQDSGDPETRGSAFDPAGYYSYPLDEVADIPQIVTNGAGPRLAEVSDN